MGSEAGYRGVEEHVLQQSLIVEPMWFGHPQLRSELACALA
jgi:hypothetical protein